MYDWKVKFDDRTHAVLAYLEMLDPFGYDENPPETLISLSYSKEDEKKVDKLLKSIDTKGKKLIGMTVSSAETSMYRRWPPERFALLADKLIEKHDCVVIFPDKADEKEYIDRIIDSMKHGAFNLAGRTSLHELFCLIEKCDVYVSNDTGPMHAAAAMGVRTIGLFGPNTPVRYHPYGIGNVSIYKCDHPPYINTHKGSFKTPHHFCMNKITVGDVLRAVENVLG